MPKELKKFVIADPCTNCGNPDMDIYACPSVKGECLDCCGCPDHQ